MGTKNCKSCAISTGTIAVICVIVAFVLVPPASYIVWAFAGMSGAWSLVTALAVLTHKDE
jgi:hypothetical protein